MRDAAETYPLSHFREHTDEHIERLANGRIETITRDGDAAMVVMSPQTYDALKIELERGQDWDRAVLRIGERQGRDARLVIQEAARKAGLEV